MTSKEHRDVPMLLQEMQARQDSLKSVLIIYRTVDEFVGWDWDAEANIYEYIGALETIRDDLRDRVRELPAVANDD